ncbi:MAG: energy-coupling factor transporter transmembrane protein EcfT [Lachnospiraceae bacterium]|nr:energy-coupling factor transporter transmembrane protein EcfT [Lachnospiraceae bacterium]
MIRIFNYIDRPSPIHRLTGASKFAVLILWSIAAMTTFCTPFLVALTVLGFILFAVSRIRLKEVRAMLILTMAIMLLNNILIYLFAPEQGVSIYGSRDVIATIVGRYTITKQQLLYHANVILKYTATIPLILLFVATTNPSEFAASLNRLGVNYRIAYAVALAMRYIPDTQNEYHDISLSQQARGVEMSKKEHLFKRIAAAASIILPLILSGMDRIDVIANAMELRGFGKNRKRTWYMGRKFAPADIFCIIFGFMLVAFTTAYSVLNGSRFWNPFV